MENKETVTSIDFLEEWRQMVMKNTGGQDIFAGIGKKQKDSDQGGEHKTEKKETK